MLIRLNKFLSEAGICSRRQADEHILAGNVTVNGQLAAIGARIDPEIDVVVCLGKTVTSFNKLVYYALYKPKGVITSSDDELGRKIAIELVPREPRVYSVGRLDIASEGLLILTNDGDLTNRLTHPSFAHEKEYRVNVEFLISNIENKHEYIKSNFLGGLNIDGKLMQADRVFDFRELENRNSTFVSFSLVLHTGYNRQIRKMCDKLGLSVKKLVRTRIGKLSLADLHLEAGQYKLITKEQIL